MGSVAGCDVLWGGCPMITLPLERMASRVAASLCYATGLGHEMVVNSQQVSLSQSCLTAFVCTALCPTLEHPQHPLKAQHKPFVLHAYVPGSQTLLVECAGVVSPYCRALCTAQFDTKSAQHALPDKQPPFTSGVHQCSKCGRCSASSALSVPATVTQQKPCLGPFKPFESCLIQLHAISPLHHACVLVGCGRPQGGGGGRGEGQQSVTGFQF